MVVIAHASLMDRVEVNFSNLLNDMYLGWKLPKKWGGMSSPFLNFMNDYELELKLNAKPKAYRRRMKGIPFPKFQERQ